MLLTNPTRGGGPLARNAKNCQKQKSLFNNPSEGKSAGVSGYFNLNLGSAVEVWLTTGDGEANAMGNKTHVGGGRRGFGFVCTLDATYSSVTFRHSPRLQWPSLQYFTQE
jgi:hypothetical protein